MNIPQPITLFPRQPDLLDQISILPPSGGLYCLVLSGSAPHLAWSANLRRRLQRLLLGQRQSGSSAAPPLRFRLQRIDCWPTGSKLETSLLTYGVARRLFPEDYARQLRLRLPWFVRIADRAGFPRLAVTNRAGGRDVGIWGPFASREAAEYYQEEVLRLHQIRRCAEVLHPSPEHPGCIYGEMNQCVRPCQCAVSRDEYQTEFGRVSEFLRSNGKAALSVLSAARASASENMAFEQAAHIHKRIEQVKTAIGAREEYVAELGDFHGVAVTKGVSNCQVLLWPLLAGFWQPPLSLNVSAEQANSRPLDAELRERLTAAEAAREADGDPLEHLSLFLRWYRSSWRDGVWLGCSSLAALNYRKLVREISKLAKDMTNVC